MSDMSGAVFEASSSQEVKFQPIWSEHVPEYEFRSSNLGARIDARCAGIADDEHNDMDALRLAQAKAEAAAAYNPDEPAEALCPASPAMADFEQELAESYRRGVEDGRKIALEHCNNSQAAGDRLAAAIETLNPLPGERISTMVLETVIALLEKSFGDISPDVEMLKQHCDKLAGLVTHDMNDVRLHIHPEDLALLGDASCGLDLYADHGQPRGTLCLSHSDGWIEQGAGPLLDELRAMLAELEGKQ